MPALPISSPRPLPLWLKAVGSVFAVGHLLIIGLYVLAADSGPWPFNTGNSPALGPKFATLVTIDATYPYYLTPLHMTHNYHFASNRPADFAVCIMAQLKNDVGDVRTLKFPDDKANFWVRHRQEILAQHLVPDQRMPPRGNQPVPAPGKELPKVEIWAREAPWEIRLKQVDALDDVLRSPDIDQPSPRAKLLAQSYARYLCRETKSVSAELTRHSRTTVMPSDLYVPRPDLFNELKSHFGEYRREQ